jgi:replicative DNA helicase
MADRIESVILRNLIWNEDYVRKVLPYIKDEYFRKTHEKALFNSITEHVTKYNARPTVESLEIALQSDSTLYEDNFKEAVEALKTLENDIPANLSWLVDQTEEFCRDKALANAAFKAVSILEGQEKKLDKGAIPEIFEQALAVSFDPSVGHDYLLDAEERYDLLHSVESKLPFDIDICNTVTKGGVPSNVGTLNILGAGVYVGKTLGLCHLAASYMKQGKNALYITLEISEENIGFRIDCNALNISTDESDNIPKDVFMRRVDKLKAQKGIGKLIVKGYPAGSIHVNNIRALLHELHLKHKYTPDVILVDYLNLMASSRFKPSDKTHITIQAIAEELRALGQEYKIPIWTATQLDAEGMNSSDPSMTNISGSKVGLAATCDLLWMLVSSEKMREIGQILVIQQKNRYKDASDQKNSISAWTERRCDGTMSSKRHNLKGTQ